MSAPKPMPTEVSLDLCHRDNGFLHHTRQYQQNEEAQAALVVRRGAPFRLMLKFNAELNSGSTSSP
uniref:Transglut_N domain-containing protein n=1 Tax=Macrostomum lignano TaxID=282301 RepID=A0A1I8HE28_9PLAT